MRLVALLMLRCAPSSSLPTAPPSLPESDFGLDAIAWNATRPGERSSRVATWPGPRIGRPARRGPGRLGTPAACRWRHPVAPVVQGIMTAMAGASRPVLGLGAHCAADRPPVVAALDGWVDGPEPLATPRDSYELPRSSEWPTTGGFSGVFPLAALMADLSVRSLPSWSPGRFNQFRVQSSRVPGPSPRLVLWWFTDL